MTDFADVAHWRAMAEALKVDGGTAAAVPYFDQAVAQHPRNADAIYFRFLMRQAGSASDPPGMCYDVSLYIPIAADPPTSLAASKFAVTVLWADAGRRRLSRVSLRPAYNV